MKKQILILIVAFFAVTTAFGQKAIHDSAPFGTTGCTDDALHPFAGKSYNYAAIVNPTGGNFLWWATKDPNFITNQTTDNSGTKLTVGTGLTAASASYGVTSTTPNVDITWSSSVLSNTTFQGTPGPTNSPTFVVVKYDAPATGCSNNLKVYELNPKNGFTVDIKNLKNTTFAPAAYGTNESQCIDKVSKATYASGAMVYEYGTNIFFYEVVAANFSVEWKPTIVITLANAVQTSVLEWTYDKNLATATWAPYVAGTTKFETDATDTSNGVSVYLRLTVTNNNFENNATANATGKDIVLAIDGQNKDNQWDIKNSDCTDPAAADTDDKATQTLLPRPSVDTGVFTPAPTSNPTTIIGGNQVN